MALPAAVMNGDSVLTCVVAAARHTLEAAGATHLHTGGENGGVPRSKRSRLDARLGYVP